MRRFTFHNWFVSIVIATLLISFGQETASAKDDLSNTKITVDNVEQIQVLNSVSLSQINQLAWSNDEETVAVATFDGCGYTMSPMTQRNR